MKKKLLATVLAATCAFSAFGAAGCGLFDESGNDPSGEPTVDLEFFQGDYQDITQDELNSFCKTIVYTQTDAIKELTANNTGITWFLVNDQIYYDKNEADGYASRNRWKYTSELKLPNVQQRDIFQWNRWATEESFENDKKEYTINKMTSTYMDGINAYAYNVDQWEKVDKQEKYDHDWALIVNEMNAFSPNFLDAEELSNPPDGIEMLLWQIQMDDSDTRYTKIKITMNVKNIEIDSIICETYAKEAVFVYNQKNQFIGYMETYDVKNGDEYDEEEGYVETHNVNGITYIMPFNERLTPPDDLGSYDDETTPPASSGTVDGGIFQGDYELTDVATLRAFVNNTSPTYDDAAKECQQNNEGAYFYFYKERLRGDPSEFTETVRTCHIVSNEYGNPIFETTYSDTYQDGITQRIYTDGEYSYVHTDSYSKERQDALTVDEAFYNEIGFSCPLLSSFVNSGEQEGVQCFMASSNDYTIIKLVGAGKIMSSLYENGEFIETVQIGTTEITLVYVYTKDYKLVGFYCEVISHYTDKSEPYDLTMRYYGVPYEAYITPPDDLHEYAKEAVPAPEPSVPTSCSHDKGYSVSLDETSHEMICGDCGDTIAINEHNFSGGFCGCGYVCPHEWGVDEYGNCLHCGWDVSIEW